MSFILACRGNSRPGTTSELTFAAYRDCSRDAADPSLTLLSVQEDGSQIELGTLLNSSKVRWGRHTRARLRARRNPVKQHKRSLLDGPSPAR